MPDSKDPRHDAPRGNGPHEHDTFVVDTRRAKGNRRATPPAPVRLPRGEAGERPLAREDGPRQNGRLPDSPHVSEADDTARPIPQGMGRRPGRASRPARSRVADRDGDETRIEPRGAAGPRPSSAEPMAASLPAVRRVSSDDGDYYIGGPSAPPPAPDQTRAMPAEGARAPRGPRRRGPQGPSGPGGSGGSHGSGPAVPPAADGPRKRRRGRKFLVGALVFALLWIGGLLWAGNSAWNKVARVDALPAEHLANSGSGTNTLIVGSDGRGGLTAAQRKELGTGQAEGQRTDSIMVLHNGGPKPTLLSIPRDSYVSIPGHTKNKINASFSLGGPQLLIRTIEQNTGIHIDNYMEIGFGGFASVVDAVGGVDICVARDMDDKKAHINLKKGCQTLNGANALGYVRARYSDPEGDIGRAKRQRQFLGALMKKIGSPSNLLVPWKLKGLGESGAQGLSVDKDMSMFRAMRIMWTLKGFSGDSGNSVVVPVGDSALMTPVGEVVSWDTDRADALFKAMRENGDTSSFVKKSAAATN